MTLIANNDNPVDQAEEIIETTQQEKAEAATNDHKTYSGQSTMMWIDDLLAGKTQIDL